ncbi:rab11 family-interacting protein 1 [Gastrophryne carolinensis]
MALAQQSQTWFPTHVQVTVLQAKGLRSKGKAGTNDAYAIIQLGKEKYSTTVAEKSLAPVWKEEATFEVPLLHNDNQERCTVRVIVMHRALVGMDKFLGQLELNLWELHQSRNRRKVQWFPLKSKPGKKEKERGQVEVEVQFMRNNMTASMFDLSMKEKSRSPFGKLKDKIKGKRQDGLPDTASAIVPSMNQYGDDSDEEMPDVDKKKSKLKTLFSKPGLKKSPLSQSMSVLPTHPPSPSQRTVLKPGDFSSDFHQASGSPVSERRFPHLPVIMTHKRTASADTSGNKKDGLSIFSGLRPKNDPITRSNLCINGNHVYMEEAEPKSDSSKDSSVASSPQLFRKTPLFASAENLSYKPPKETVSTSNNDDKGLTFSASASSLKSIEQSATTQSSQVEEPRSKSPPAASSAPKELKENKKPESKKSSLLSLVTGRKETPKPAEAEQFNDVFLNEAPKAGNAQQSVEVPSKKSSLNPFEEDLEEKKKPEPLPAERNAKTSAVKPRLDVSSEAETKARLSSSVSNDTSLAPFSDEQENSSKSYSSDYIPHSLNKDPSISERPIVPKVDSLDKELTESSNDQEKSSLPSFWRSSNTSSKPAEPKEVNVVAPFSDKNKTKKTYMKSLLDQLKGKSTDKKEENVVDEDLVRGILPIHENASVIEPASPSTSGRGSFDENEDVFSINPMSSVEVVDRTIVSNKEVPKPTPRLQSVPQKIVTEEAKPEPPKPAPRSGKLNKTLDSEPSVPPPTSGSEHSGRSSPESLMEYGARVGASPVDSQITSARVSTNIKMASPLIEDFGYRLEELPVIPENPEGTSDDEHLDAKDVQSPVGNSHASDHAKGKPADVSNSKVKAEVEVGDSDHQHSPEIPASTNYPCTSDPSSVSLPNDNTNSSRTDPQIKPTIDVSDKLESTGKKKLLRAWVSPSETHPIPTVQNGGAVSSRQRTNPVKPMNTSQSKPLSSFPQPIKNHEHTLSAKTYDPTDPAYAYAELTHDELIKLVLKQKELLNHKEAQVRSLEEYIDNLLVRVMEETPNLLSRSPAKLSKKAGRI